TYCKTALNIPDASLGATSFNEALAAWNTQARDGFIRIVLTEPSAAFGHKIWPALFAKQSIANNPPDFTKNSLPDPPYVPVVNGISLGYTADQTIELNGAKSERGYFFHHEPFGYRMVTAHGLLLPAFGGEIKNEDGTLETGVGESFWFIGISGARAMAQVSLLLQMSEGSEDISIDTPKVYWNYLSKDGWKHFGDHWQADDTDGLLRSGIVRFIVPQDATFESTELASGMFWIKAWVKENSGGIPNAVAVHANAVKALLQGQPHPSHFQQALAAGEVKRLFLPDAAIKKVHQPFPSFGGKPAGSGIGFYTRVSERLRHKNRAVTIWDYERLVLQEFPEVYKVKCLNHTGYACSKEDELPGYRENLPGQVMLVPLPFANRVQTADIFQPVFSASMLSRIKAYIRGDDAASSCKPFTKALHTRLAKLHVENPKYETITVTCSIRVKDCLDPFVHRERLHEDLNLLLSPWISGGTSALRFGGSLHVSILVYFMEQLSYIDHVEQVAMVQSHAGESTALNISDPDTARATTSRSVLTSSNAHIINLLDI
ncbi:MAG TPA: hypothetical protein VK907_12650, partial [Phnomibacter sp.]|nr:hypothetical protein [Phnomibacter sp.]